MRRCAALRLLDRAMEANDKFKRNRNSHFQSNPHFQPPRWIQPSLTVGATSPGFAGVLRFALNTECPLGDAGVLRASAQQPEHVPSRVWEAAYSAMFPPRRYPQSELRQHFLSAFKASPQQERLLNTSLFWTGPAVG